MLADIKALEECIGYEFKNTDIPEVALTHTSYANERKINKRSDYERLEFLGDAVLELVTSEFIFENFPENKEGEMTRLRASLVCEPTLSMCIKEMGVNKLILLGKGEEATGGRERDSILCDVFEAIAGAIYLDGGYEAAKKYISTFLLSDWKNKIMFTDSKSLLQEKLQKTGHKIAYNTVSEDGPANARIFTEELLVDGRGVTRAEGRSKKEAQQKAAYEYLLRLSN